MNASKLSDDVLRERNGAIALATLSRPKALNALSLNMIRAYDAALRSWAVDPSVGAV
ncbi:MAG: enoyl-CoA hydratase/isomerase family protein, partial [Alphaproteobacteria bacterium]|nr:enoyl-CoA hydratase/isomerase family protein [Alphaproteobacteria bacterium]